MLRHNFGYKILALLAAVFLWFYVMLTQRFETQGVMLPVETRNLPKKLVASVEPSRVRVFLRGTSETLASPTPALTAYVNAAAVTPGRHTLSVRYIAPPELRVVRIAPSKVTLTVEPVISKTVKIEPNIVGIAPADYILGEPVITPSTAAISGMRDAVARVRHLLVNVDANDLSSSTPHTGALRAVDDEGAAVEGVELSPTQARVVIPVERRLRYQTVPVVLRTEGEPAAGYRIAGASVRPPLVTIAGEAERLRGVTAVRTVPVDVDGAEADIRRGVVLALPEGIISVADSQVEVHITIEPTE